MGRSNQKPGVDGATSPNHQASSVCEVVSALEAGKQGKGRGVGPDDCVSIALALGHVKAMPKSILKPFDMIKDTSSELDGTAFRRATRRHSSYNSRNRKVHKAAHEAMVDLFVGGEHSDGEQSLGELVSTSPDGANASDFKNAIEQIYNQSMAFENLELLHEDHKFAQSCPAILRFYDDEEDSVELVKIRRASLCQSPIDLANLTIDASSGNDDLQVNMTVEEPIKDNDNRILPKNHLLSGSYQRRSFTVPLKTAEESDGKARSCRSLHALGNDSLKSLREFLDNSKNGLIDFSDSEHEELAKDTY
jgi:hypothetical protein